MNFEQYIKDPKKIIYSLGMKGKLGFINDKTYLKIMFWANTGKKLNLNNPKTYNEKLQWLKLNDKKEEYTKMVDKYEVKKYISKIVGNEYIIPTLGIWDSFDQIDFDSLPNQFVLKCTHDSGGLVICTDKETFNKVEAKKKINNCLKRNYFLVGREYPYKNVKPRIIAEKYMCEEDNDEDTCLTDYKFFCFNGKPKILYISKDHSENPTTDFFDINFNLLPIRMRDENSKIPPRKPEKLEEMIELSSKLSKGIKHLRVDFYIIKGHVYVGELTFYHGSGFSLVYPDEWNTKLGDFISID